MIPIDAALLRAVCYNSLQCSLPGLHGLRSRASTMMTIMYRNSTAFGITGSRAERQCHSVEYLPVCIFQRNQNTAHSNQNLVCIPEKVVYIPFDQLNQNGCSHRTTLWNPHGIGVQAYCTRMKMYVHVPYIYVLGTVRQCKEDFVTMQLPCNYRASLLIPGIYR